MHHAVSISDIFATVLEFEYRLLWSLHISQQLLYTRQTHLLCTVTSSGTGKQMFYPSWGADPENHCPAEQESSPWEGDWGQKRKWWFLSGRMIPFNKGPLLNTEQALELLLVQNWENADNKSLFFILCIGSAHYRGWCKKGQFLAVWSVKGTYPVKGAFPSIQDSHWL